ncbi:ABC transporter permease [Georgenia yuyongxinii]|uniref:Transport permease protein n=1 Tax=Georgenia yuyongxinii TaxID=2589797 RepID=A0A552WKT6_9MICO|nr:ABC transporter permease [Georgenia yuyongxinii]TRW43390.1 ABC transporter [Georgenia yuyongxinii]
MSAPTARGAPPTLQPARRRWLPVLGFWWLQYRRTWVSSVVSRFLMPLMFLLSLGLMLGSLVDRSAGGVDGVPYLHYVVPGILAAQAMWAALTESTYSVLGAIRWTRQYHAMLATPIGVADVLAGHLAYVALSLTLGTVAFVAVAALFGAWASWGVLLAIPVAVLTGMAFAAPCFAVAARFTDSADTSFSVIYRLVVTPLFLVSGTFFPVEQLPALLRPVAWVTPLWHGVEACRALTSPAPAWAAVAGHVAVLALMTAAGLWWARRAFTRRLVV